MSAVDVVILAAGASQRLGRPKQLLPYRGTTLLGHLAQQAVSSKARRVLVVSGACGPEIEEALASLPVEIVHNSQWKEGVGASVRAAADRVRDGDPPPQALLYMTCDQPFVGPETINRIIGVHRASPEKIVASRYGGSLGAPALFPRSRFAELSRLSGDRGAQSIILSRPNDVLSVPFPAGSVDIDVPQDLGALGIESNDLKQGDET